jgi:superfamily II DNA/RNA helicase
MPPEIKRLADAFLRDPIRVEASKPATAASTISQYIVASGREPVDKRAVLRALIRGAAEFKNAIIFANRKRDVATLQRSLSKHGFNAGGLHGDMDQRSRTQTLDDFRKGKLTLLVASDVAARGLDIPAVSHVFNFDVPTHAEDYVHRIGRTGRAGLKGTAITIATSLDRKYVAAIEKMIGTPIPPMEIEAGEERAAAFSKGRSERDDASEGDNHRGGRGRRGGRGERHEHRERPAEVHADEPAALQAERPVAQEAPAPQPRREEAPRHEPRPQRDHRGDDRRGPRNEHQRRDHHQQQRPHDQRRDRRQDRDDGPPVVGLGDHMPDFLRRSVKIPSETD